jgi:hypothetical protein
MSYTITTFGATNQYAAKYPNTRIYVFSPYYVLIQTDTVGQEVTMTCNGYSFMRVSDANKYAKFPVNKILESFFVGKEFGDVLAASTNEFNSSSKLILTSKNIAFHVDDDTGHTLTLTYNLIWGALQQGESERTTDEIYAYDNGTNYLPLTVTCNMGDNIGKEAWISALMDSSPISTYSLLSGATPVKTYTIVELPYCAGGHYLRWISPEGEYRYFYFAPGISSDELEDGVDVKQNIWSMEASTNGEIKNDLAMKDKKGKPYYDAVVLNATYNQQVHLKGLQRAIKTWIWENSTWIETRVAMDSIQVDRFRKPKEVNVKIYKPSLFLQSL